MKTYTDQELEDRLLDYLYDELDEDERAAYEEAVASRPALLAELEAHRGTRAELRGLESLSGGAALDAALASVFAEAEVAAAGAAQPVAEASGGSGPWWRRLGASLRQAFFSPAFAVACAGLFVVGGAVWLVERAGQPPDKPLASHETALAPIEVAEAPEAPALAEEGSVLAEAEKAEAEAEPGSGALGAAFAEATDLEEAEEVLAGLDDALNRAPALKAPPAKPAAAKAEAAPKKTARAKTAPAVSPQSVAGLALDEVAQAPSNLMEPAVGMNLGAQRDSGYAPPPAGVKGAMVAKDHDDAAEAKQIAAAPRELEMQARRERSATARPQADSGGAVERARGGAAGSGGQGYAAEADPLAGLWTRFERELRAEELAAAERTLAELRRRGADAAAISRAERRVAAARDAGIQRAAPTPTSDE